jgi:hypothetical protein
MSTTDEGTPGERMDRTERSILQLLLCDGFPWTVDELGRGLGDQGRAVDAVASLAGDGLVHRVSAAPPDGEPVEFVVPSRAARRSDELYGGAS